MRHILIIFVLFFSVSCKNQDIDIGKPENYSLTESNISNDCNIYQMRFKDGKYILKFSLAGSCKSLDSETYIREYSRYLNSFSESLIKKRGYIIFDYYGINENKNVLQDSVMNITKKHFKAFVSLSEVDKNGFTIKVGNVSD